MFVVSRNFAYRIEHYLQRGRGAGRDEKVWTGISLYYSLGNSIKALTRHYRNFESGKVTGYRCTRMYPPFSGSEEELNKNWIPKALVKKVAASACAPFRNEIRHRLGRCHRCWWPQVLLLWAHCLCCKRVAALGSKIRGHLIGKHHFPK